MSTAVVEPIVSYAPTRPVEVMPQLQQVTRSHRCIVSIWPAPLRARRRHNGITFYELAAAPRGSYSKLVVYDTQEWVNVPSEQQSKGEMHPRTIPVDIVAMDLVTTWAGDTIGSKSGYSPGIMVIAGDDPTPEELAALRATQNNLFNWFISDANSKHISGEGVNISDTHRLAAKEMLDRGAERLPWFPVVQFAAVKECIACGKQIEQKAKKCPECEENLVDWYMKYDLDSSADPAVHSFIQMLKLKQENAALKQHAAEPAPTLPIKKDLEPRLATK